MDKNWDRFVVFLDEESDVSLDSVLDIIASCRNGEIKTEVEQYQGESLIYCESPVGGTAEFCRELRRREIRHKYIHHSETFGMYCAIGIPGD